MCKTLPLCNHMMLLQDVYETFNILLRRKPKENNFKVLFSPLLYESFLVVSYCFHYYYRVPIFFKPLRETKVGLEYRLVQEIRGRITVLD